MDEKLYYEAEVKYGDDVRKVYDAAVERNAKFYRGISVSGKYFGWADGKFVHAEEGQEWFENPHYTKPDEEDEPIEEIKSKEKPLTDEAADEQVKSDEETLSAETDSVDALKARNALLESYLDDVDNNARKYKKLLAEKDKELSELKNAVKVIINFIKEV